MITKRNHRGRPPGATRAPGAEVVVLGGGPAGSSLAIALARVGHRVRLLERARFPRHRIGESLPPKVVPPLEILGVADRIDRAGFLRMGGTTVCLGREITSHPFHPEGRRLGYQVDRALFDQLLLDAAREVGVSVEEGARVVGVTLGQAGCPAAVRLRRGSAAEEIVPGRFVVDATGTAAVVARALSLRRRDPVRTVALAGYWRGAKAPVELPATDTLFEMLPDGWIWSVLRHDGLRNVTVGLDPARLRGGGAVRDLYLARARTSRLVGALIQDAALERAPSLHDATGASSRRYAGDGFLLCGDAASSIDPLTSEGVYKALQSGIVGAAVINTILRRPEDGCAAIDYFQASQERFQRSYAELARSFYLSSPHRYEPFWRERLVRQPEWMEFDDDAAGRRAALRSELESRVREVGGDRLRVRVRPLVAVAERPAVENGFIVRRAALVASGREVEIAAPRVDPGVLLDLLDGRAVAEVFEGYVARTGRPRSRELARDLMGVLLALAEHDLLEVWS